MKKMIILSSNDMYDLKQSKRHASEFDNVFRGLRSPIRSKIGHLMSIEAKLIQNSMIDKINLRTIIVEKIRENISNESL